MPCSLASSFGGGLPCSLASVVGRGLVLALPAISCPFVAGFEQAVAGVHADHYGPQNALVVVVGDVPVELARAALSDAAGDLDRGATTHPLRRPASSLAHRPSTNATARATTASPAPNDPTPSVLRPLTDTTPKPLLTIAGKPLIEYHIQALSAAGFGEIVINQGHLGDQLPAAIGDGSRWNLEIQYSTEGDELLETGGIAKALPLLGDSAFAVINADIWTDFDFARLRNTKCDYAHLVLVDNPEQHPEGDFQLSAGLVKHGPGERLTFSGIAVYHPRFFAILAMTFFFH